MILDDKDLNRNSNQRRLFLTIQHLIIFDNFDNIRVQNDSFSLSECKREETSDSVSGQSALHLLTNRVDGDKQSSLRTWNS